MERNVECSRVALIVEDDQELRALAVALLEETYLRVAEASSAEEALQYLRYHAEDVAFLFSDVKLPCLMTGLDLARTVRLKWPWIRMVLTSGAPLEEDLGKTLRHVRLMPKPWRALEVLVEAERAAEASRYEAIVSHPDGGSSCSKSVIAANTHRFVLKHSPESPLMETTPWSTKVQAKQS